MTRPGPRTRGYTKRWEKTSKQWLSRGQNRYCKRCRAEGRLTIATTVHHRVAHKGDNELFWNSNNWEPICDEHHNRDAQQEERRGYRSTVGSDGIPFDANHPFLST